MKASVKILAVEKLGKSGYFRFWGDSAGSDDEYSKVCSCFAKEPDVPDLNPGDVVEAVVYRNGKDNQFELV